MKKQRVMKMRHGGSGIEIVPEMNWPIDTTRLGTNNVELLTSYAKQREMRLQRNENTIVLTKIT
jgi:hypothetical protein